MNPDASLAVELVWDSADYDFDLHLIKDSGAYCSGDSCYYGNCNADNSFVLLPEWDGVPGETAGDPALVIDDLEGYGPERIEIVTAVDADYTVAVHAYSTVIDTPVWATVRIYIDGALAHEDSRQFNTGRAFWEAADIQWSNGQGVIFPLTTFETNWSCP